MKKLDEYAIIHTSSAEELAKYVQDHIDKGWVPQGGPYVTEIRGQRFNQAMVKYEEEVGVTGIEQLHGGGKRLHYSNGTHTDIHPHTTDLSPSVEVRKHW